MKDLLLLHDGFALPGSVIHGYLSVLGLGFEDLHRLAVASQQGPALDVATATRQPFSTILSVSSTAGFHSSAVAAKIAGALKPGGVLFVQEPAPSQEQLGKVLLLGGLVDIQPGPTLHELGAGQSVLTVKARKPEWDTGAKAAISLRPKAKQKAAAFTAPAPVQPAPAEKQSIWSLPANDDDELIDDDELLTEEDRQRPAVPSGAACAPSKKACANCTCGRAEAEAAGVKALLTADMLANPQSACGSCGLGDAFRCSTCPYRGLPTFKTGEKISLSSDFLTADA